MKNAAKPTAPFPVQQLQDTGGTASRMDQQGLVRLPRQVNHPDKNLFLNFPGNSDLTVEAHFTERDRLRMCQKTSQSIEVRRLATSGCLRMDAGGCENTGMPFGGRHQFRPVIRRDSGHDPGVDAGISGLLELGAKRIQSIQVDMGINKAGHDLQSVSQPIAGNQSQYAFCANLVFILIRPLSAISTSIGEFD